MPPGLEAIDDLLREHLIARDPQHVPEPLHATHAGEVIGGSQLERPAQRIDSALEIRVHDATTLAPDADARDSVDGSATVDDHDHDHDYGFDQSARYVNRSS